MELLIFTNVSCFVCWTNIEIIFAIVKVKILFECPVAGTVAFSLCRINWTIGGNIFTWSCAWICKPVFKHCNSTARFCPCSFKSKCPTFWPASCFITILTNFHWFVNWCCCINKNFYCLCSTHVCAVFTSKFNCPVTVVLSSFWERNCSYNFFACYNFIVTKYVISSRSNFSQWICNNTTNWIYILEFQIFCKCNIECNIFFYVWSS